MCRPNRFFVLRYLLSYVTAGLLGWPVLAVAAGLTWQVRNPTPTVERLNDLTTGPGGIAAVGDYGAIITSADGQQWTLRSAGVTTTLRAVTSGGGRYVAVGDAGTVVTSTDGVAWQSVSAGTANHLTAVAYFNGGFYATAQGGIYCTSANGTMWNAASSTFSHHLNTVAVGAGRLVIYGNSGLIWTTTNGNNWSSSTLVAPGVAVNADITSATFVGGKFYVVAGGTAIFSSTDGVSNWQQVSGGNSTRIFSVQDRLYGLQDLFSVRRLLDNGSWQTVYSPVMGVTGIGAANGLFLTYGASGSIATSPDTTEWTGRTSFGAGKMNLMTFGGGRFVTTDGYNALIGSADAVRWTVNKAFGVTLSADGSYSTVTYGAGLYFSPLGGFKVAVSRDGATWSEATSGLSNAIVAFGAGRFVGLSAGNVYTSANGLTWTLSASSSVPANTGWLRYLNGLFVAFGADGRVDTSPDGMVWTQRALPISTGLRGVAAGAGRWVGIATNGSIVASTNGATWVARGSFRLGLVMKDVVFGAGQFVALGVSVLNGVQSVVATSADGETWTEVETPRGFFAEGLAAGNGTVLFAGGNSIVFQATAGPLPTIQIQPMATSVTSGQLATLSVAAEGSGPLTYQWFEGGSGDTSKLVAGATNATFATPTLTEDRAYWVRVTSGTVSVDSVTSFVTIRIPPAISLQPTNALAIEGGRFTLTAEASGVPLPEFQWYEGASGDLTHPVTGATGKKLTGTLAQAPKQFWMRATNSGGSANSAAAWAVPLNAVPPPDMSGASQDIVYANGGFIVLRGSSCLTSSDGRTWVSRPIGTNLNLRGLAFGGGRFVAVGALGGSATSTDGISWSVSSVAGVPAINDVTFGGGRFVAVGAEGFNAFTADGQTWTTGAALAEELIQVVYYGEQFVALSAKGTVFRSDNGQAWIANGLKLPVAARYLAAGNGRLVAAGGDGATYVSTDGSQWRVSSPMLSGLGFSGVFFDGTRFVLLGGALAFYSADGIVWTPVTGPGAGDSVSIGAAGGGRMVVVGNGGRVMLSENGTTWTNVVSGIGGGQISHVGGRFFAAGGALTSLNGLTWQATNAPMTFTVIVYGNGRFVGLGGGGSRVSFSEDGVNWAEETTVSTTTLRGLTFGNGRFVAVGGEAALYSSTDGVVWSAGTVDVGGNSSIQYQGVAFGAGLFLALGQGNVDVSSDGQSWTRRYVSTIDALTEVEFVDGRFFVRGVSGNVSSVDGLSFVPASNLSLSTAGVGTVRGLGLFMRASSGVSYSSDGLTYASLVSFSTSNAAFGNGTFVVASDRFYRSAPILGMGRIADQSFRVSGVTGQSATLSVTVGDGASAGYQWFRGARGDTTQPIVGATSRTLAVTVGATTVAYWVRLSLTEGAIDSATMFADPEAPPVIVKSPLGAWVDYGSTATLSVRAVAIPSANYQWYEGEQGDTSRPLMGATTPTLTLNVVTTTKRYWVRVTNSKGGADSEVAWIGAITSGAAMSATVRDVVYAQGRFVAVGDSGEVKISDDGENWEAAERATFRSLSRVVYGNGRFVAVGEGGTVLTSPDGRAWSASLNQMTDDLVGIAVGPNRFVAVGKNTRLLSSVDGLTWQPIAAPVVGDFMGVASDGVRFIALASNRAIATSSDGVTWSAGSIPTGLDIRQIVASSAGFLVTGVDGSLLASLEGTRWTPWVAPSASTSGYRYVGVTEGKFILAGDNFAYASSDGASWEKFLQPGIWDAVSLGGGSYVAFVGAAIYSSSDGVNWTNRTALPTGVSGRVTFGSGRFTTVNSNGTFATSIDGRVWRVTATAFLGGTTPFVVSGGNRDLIYRRETTAWTVRKDTGEFIGQTGPAANVTNVVFGAGHFIALTATGALHDSTDLGAWTLRLAAATPRMSALGFGGNAFLALGSGTSATSPDGVVWTRRTQGPAQEPVAMAFGRGRWVAVLANRTVSVSTDTQVWSVPRLVPDLPVDGTELQFVEGMFMIGNFVSSDGVNWSRGGRAGAFGNGVLLGLDGGTGFYRSIPLEGLPLLRDATENVFALSGQLARLTVEAEGTGLTYQWFSGRSGDISQPISGATAVNYSATAGAAVQFFWARVAGSRGAVDSPTLTVRPASAPAITSAPRSAIFGPTQSVTFSVAASGAPAPTYRWFEGESGDVTRPLKCNSATYLPLDRGTRRRLWVRASNLAGSADSAAATAEVVERIQPVTYGKTRAMAFGGGRWVGVGDEGQIMVSADGERWLSSESRIQRDWAGVIYGAGKFVAVGAGGNIATSADGVRWNLDLSPTAETLKAIAFHAGKFVAVGGLGTIVTSTDGLNWSLAASGTVDSLTDVATDGTYVFALAKDGALLVSANGASWASHTIGSSLRLTRLAVSGGQFMATSESGFAMFSVDGFAWTRRDLPGDLSLSVPGNLVAFAGGFGLMATPATLLTTTNGTSWTRRSVPTNKDALFLLAAGGRYFSIGRNSRAFFSSADLVNWTDLAPQAPDTVVRTLQAGGKIFLGGNDWTLLVEREDGEWRRTDSLFPGYDPTKFAAAGVTAIAFGQGRFVATGGVSGKIATSTDGLVWTTIPFSLGGASSGVVFAQGMFVCVGTAGVFTSPDGLTWTARPVAFVPLLQYVPAVRTVTYAAGLFVAAGNELITSPDGVTWTVRAALDYEFPYTSIAYGAGQFLVEGGGVSRDGVSWDTPSFHRDHVFGTVTSTYGGDLFVAVGSNDGAASSPDATVWRDVSVAPVDIFGTSNACAGAAYNNGVWTLSTRGGVIFRTALPAVPASSVLAINSSATLDLALGESANFTVTTSNGVATAFGATGLPPGLVLNATTGVISGSSTVPGAYRVLLHASSSAGFASAVLTLSIASLASPPSDLSLGDGLDDLIVQNRTTGERGLWQMTGLTVAKTVSVTTQPVPWVISASADFNRDGKTDWLWQNRSTGQCAIWFGQGVSRNLPTLGLEWLVVAAGDFAGDSSPDFVVQNLTTGECGVWVLNNGVVSSYVKIMMLPVEWLVAGSADLDGDGKADLLVQHTATGESGVWLLNGTMPRSFRSLLTLPANWDLVAAADYSGDAQPDLLVQNRATGERGVWFVSGLTVGGYAQINSAQAPDWLLKIRARAASQTIAFAGLSEKVFGDAPVTLSATASSNLPVAISVIAGPASLVGNILTLTGAGEVRLRAVQPGDMSYASAPAVEHAFTVTRAPATVALGALEQSYAGTARVVTVTTAPPGLPVTVTYGGVTATPVAVGTYAVNATIANPNYAGAAAATLVVARAPLTIRADDQMRPIRVENPPLTVSYVGFVNGETPAVLITTPIATTTATVNSPPGQYPITVSGGNATNYALRFTDGVLSVTPPMQGTQSAIDFRSAAGTTVTISNAITYAGALSSLGWQVLLPDGWSYLGGTNEGDLKPAVGTTALAEWRWSAVPPSPITFTYQINVPPGTTGERAVAALIVAMQAGDSFSNLVKPDPLTLSFVHSADTDHNWSINLFELLRVIELYNTRVSTLRTGRYRVQAGTEDGFAVDGTAGDSGIFPLPYFHTADTNRDGRISLTELTRVIELYNQRTGTQRTGRYHVDVSNPEDGLAAGP